MPFELTLPLWYWCMAGCIWNDKFVWHYSSSHGLEFTSCIRKETEYLWRNLCARWQAHPSQHWCVCSCSHLWSSDPWRSSPIFTSGSTHPLSQRESGWLGSLEHPSELQTLIPRTQWECWNCQTIYMLSWLLIKEIVKPYVAAFIWRSTSLNLMAGDSWHSSKIIRADEKNIGII